MAGVELAEMSAGSEWAAEAARGGEAVEASTEVAAGMRGEAVGSREEEKMER